MVVLSDEEAQGAYSPKDFVKFVKDSFPKKTFAWHSIVNSLDGANYIELSKLTKGIVGNVASSNYTKQLKKMGEAVKDLQKEVSFGCDPLDDDGDGNIDMVIRFKASGSNSYRTYTHSENNYTIKEDRITFDDYLPAGDFQFQYKCPKTTNNN